MKVLITGGRGQLAEDLIRALQAEEVTAPGHEELDVTSANAIATSFEAARPDVVVNTAAFHQVDLCETEPESSFLVNAAAPQRMAAACRERGALFVHLSTDYVFDGTKREPYVESDPINPISVYGASKAAGELAIRATTSRHLIIRTTGLYGRAGMASRRGNFPETMLRLAERGEPISVVCDQVLTPSYTHDVSASIADLVRRGATGTFHVTNSGACSWYEFAEETFRLAGKIVDLRRVRQVDRPVPAPRPAYSVLAHEGLKRVNLAEPRPWQEALAAYFEERSADLMG